MDSSSSESLSSEVSETSFLSLALRALEVEVSEALFLLPLMVAASDPLALRAISLLPLAESSSLSSSS